LALIALNDRGGKLAAQKQNRHIEAISAVLANFPGGASLEQVAVAAQLGVSRRTLIRRLGEMVESSWPSVE
jgi:hypothetical protein